MLQKLQNKKAKDLFSTFFNLAWRLISGPITLLLIPLHLSEVQQGYWYLFGSIAALSTFADLGFSNIILQFSAHEYAFLSMDKDGILIGEEQYIKKIGSFFRFVIKWIATMCSFAYPIIFVVGIFFFARDEVLSIYIIPWIIYSTGSLINFFANSVLSFIEGMNQIDKIQKSRLIVAVSNTVIIAGGLLLDINIYALSCAMLFSSYFMCFTIFKTFGKTVKQIWINSKGFFYPWKKEIMPLFKKYVLSFASGYFIFQIYTPLMHYFHGPVYSGKVGLSMTLVNAMFSFSNIWVYTITPQINMFIEKKDWKTLDRVFNKRLILSCISYIFICICFVVCIKLFGQVAIIAKITSRFLPWQGLAILILSYFIQLIINSWAVYLRGHKQEPYWVTSIVSAIWVFLITLLVGKLLPAEYFFVGLLSSYVWGVPVCYLIYKKSKKGWHYGK